MVAVKKCHGCGMLLVNKNSVHDDLHVRGGAGTAGTWGTHRGWGAAAAFLPVAHHLYRDAGGDGGTRGEHTAHLAFCLGKVAV